MTINHFKNISSYITKVRVSTNKIWLNIIIIHIALFRYISFNIVEIKFLFGGLFTAGLQILKLVKKNKQSYKLPTYTFAEI